MVAWEDQEEWLRWRLVVVEVRFTCSRSFIMVARGKRLGVWERGGRRRGVRFGRMGSRL